MPEVKLPPASPDNFLDSAGGSFVAGKTISTFSDVRRILDKAVASNPENGLVIHFHGGLVSRDDALRDIVPRLSKDYRERARAYPLFFIWQSGLMETLVNNKDELLKDPTFRQLMKKVTEIVVKHSGGAASGLVFRGANGAEVKNLEEYRKEFDEWFDGKRSAPPATDNAADVDVVRTRAGCVIEQELEAEVANSVAQDPAFSDAFATSYNAVSATAGTPLATRGASVGTERPLKKVLLSDTALEQLFAPAPGTPLVTNRGIFDIYRIIKFTTKIILAVLRRYRDKRDHGLYCTVVEEVLRSAFLDYVGANIWNQMKNDTAQSFATKDSVGAAVVGALKDLDGKGLGKVTLVGHSTGAIYICNFLDAAKKAGLDTAHWQVIFLAPAVTCQRFAQAIEQHGDAALRRFRMFAMKDELESKDVLVPILYTRSLLYFVSGLLEGTPSDDGWDSVLDMPLVGMQRFIDGNTRFEEDAAVQTVVKFLKSQDFRNRVVWSAASMPEGGLSSSAAKHGAFDDEDITVGSVCHLIAHREV